MTLSRSASRFENAIVVSHSSLTNYDTRQLKSVPVYLSLVVEHYVAAIKKSPTWKRFHESKSRDASVLRSRPLQQRDRQLN